jgi:hypothetical protein
MNWRDLALAVVPLFFLQTAAHAESGYLPERMQALVAPIALYPDALISTILAATSHPDDVAAASRASQADDPKWDPSVRTLEPFPELLERMGENPQWMRELAYAARTQPLDLQQAVQSLRREAYDAGRLASSPEREVIVQGAGISIQPALPQIVYVPYYDPLLVYGRWRPAYPVVQWRPWPARRGSMEHRQDPEHRHRRRDEPNGPPSPAQRMQPQVSPAQQMQPQVSPAQQMQQQIQRDRDQQLERQRAWGR